MKTPTLTSSFLFVGALASLLLSSCLDEETNPIVSQNVTVKPEVTYESNLGRFETQEEVIIEVKPNHAIVSEFVRDGNGEVKYLYKAKPSYQGKDYVQIREERFKGNSIAPSIKITKINFIVEG